MVFIYIYIYIHTYIHTYVYIHTYMLLTCPSVRGVHWRIIAATDSKAGALPSAYSCASVFVLLHQ